MALSTFEQEGIPDLDISPSVRRAASAGADGDLVVMSGLDTYRADRSGRVETATIRTGLEGQPTVEFLSDDTVLLVSERALLMEVGEPERGYRRIAGQGMNDPDALSADELYEEARRRSWPVLASRTLGALPPPASNDIYTATTEATEVVITRRDTGEVAGRIDTAGLDVIAVAVPPDASMVILGLGSREIVVADAGTGALLRRFDSGISPPWEIYFDDRGNRAIVITHESQFFDDAFEIALDIPRCQDLYDRAAKQIDRELTEGEQRFTK